MYLKTHRLIATAAMLLVAASLATTTPAADETKPKTRVFMLQGGGHDWKNHLPMLQKILEDTGDYTVTLSEDLDELLADNIDDYDLVLFYGSGLNFSDPAQEEGLMAFVRRGKAFVGIHSASDAFKKSDAYWELVGGRFAGHGRKTFTVYIQDNEHPITKGLKSFEINDETYRHRYHVNLRMRSLVRMNDGDERQSMGWVQPFGEGRVFYTSLGHARPAWENPHFQRLAVRGIYWAAGRESEIGKNAATAP